MKYSFLVPAYKTEFLEKALGSMMEQSLNDFEIIVSDDASPNDIKSIVAKFHNSKLVYNRNKSNIGSYNLVTHWNQLVEKAQGEYIIMAADDDVYDERFLEQIDVLTKRYPTIDIFRARVRHINTHGEILWEDNLYPEYQDELSAICAYSTTCVGNYVFKKSSLVQRNGFVFFPYAMGSDNATAMVMAKNGMVNTSDILFNFRISDIQVSHVSKNKIVDQGKMKAEMQFHFWMKDLISNLRYRHSLQNERKINEFIEKRIKGGAMYCTKMYYGSLNFQEVICVYRKLNELGCFSRAIEKVLFFLDYVRSKKAYK